jgi:hypothetical protein
MQRMEQALERTEGKWEEQVRALVDAFLGFLAAEPSFARMCIVEVLGSGPRGLARRDAAIEAFFPVVDFVPRKQLSPGQELSALTPAFVTGGILEIVYAAIRRGETETLPSLAPDITRLAFRSYGRDV